jgi:hypothetical protein
MSFSSAEDKLRELAFGDATMRATFGDDTAPTNKAKFNWLNEQLTQNEIAKRAAKGCILTVLRVSTIRDSNQSGIGNRSDIRFQFDIYSLDSANSRNAAEAVIQFLRTVSLCTDSEFLSPPTAPNQNPNFLLNQRQRMIPNPASPSGPIWDTILDVRISNREDISR